VEKYLVKLWRESVHGDKVNALMSRIANNIVVVETESDSVVTDNC